MGRHIEVDHLPPIVQQYDEAVQAIESRSRHGEKINCRDLTSMIPKKLFHVCEGGLRLRSRYFATVDSAIS